MTRSPQAKDQPKSQPKGRKLSNFLCFAVYSANLAFGRAYKPILDALGLTYTQYIAMEIRRSLEVTVLQKLG